MFNTVLPLDFLLSKTILHELIQNKAKYCDNFI